MSWQPSSESLLDLVPLARRVAVVEAGSPLRLRTTTDRLAAYVRLPYDVIAGRTISADQPDLEAGDVTYDATEFADWVEAGAAAAEAPIRRDALWLGPLPPLSGWRRIDVVPDEEIRNVVRSGALLAPSATTRIGQQSLLAATVLHVSRGEEVVDVPLGPLSALTKMGFLPRDSQAAIDVAPGWIRVAAAFGSTFVSSGSNPLGMLNLL